MVTAQDNFRKLKNGKILHYIYYHCTKKKNPHCMESALELKRFTEQVDDVLNSLTISEKFQAWAIKYLHEIRKEEARAHETALERRQGLLKKITNNLDNLVIRFTAAENRTEEILTTAEFQSLKGKLLKEKVSIELELKSQGIELEQWVELSEKTFNFARYARAWFANGDIDTKRAIFACLAVNATLRDQKLSITLQKPFQSIIEQQRELIEGDIEKLKPQTTAGESGAIEASSESYRLMSG